MDSKILKHYSRLDIQKAILELSRDREVAVQFGDKGYGKRPDIIQYPGDIASLAKQGATSFHVSEERWRNPLDLKPGMKKELDDNRIGFDLIIDIDTKFIEFSKITTELLIEALKFNNLNTYFVKYSGGNGMHLAIPYESFPLKVHNIETRLLFPDAVKVVARYLKSIIQNHLSQRILELNTLEELSKSLNLPIEKLKEKNNFNPFSVVDIDPILLASRHLFRSVYSINEKTGRVSIPIDPPKISKFNISTSKIENVEVNLKFLSRDTKIQDASQLIIQAFDWNKKIQPPEIKKDQQLTELPKVAINRDFFPPCIHNLLLGIKEDGRKRAIFVLLNFLRHMGWTYETIESELLTWNKNNYEPLRDNYILAQISWHKRQKNTFLPPNCTNQIYYNQSECHKDPLCNNIKNPVQYVKKKIYLKSKNKSLK